MLASKWRIVFVLVTIVLLNNSLAWNIFPSLSKNSIENFTREKLASLRNQRNRLELRLTQEKTASGNSSTLLNPDENNDKVKIQSSQNITAVQVNPAPAPAPINAVIDPVNSTSEILRENIIQQILPNREEIFTKITEVGDKLVEMKERLEPEVKKFLTETYNSFLSNLVPYSETIGVPTYVLNSLKIPQNFDPRLQFVESVLKSVPIKSLLNSLHQLSQSRKLRSDVQGKSDDQDLVSDQEPAGIAGQMKYSHKHRNSNKRPKDTAYLISDRNGYEFGYDDFSAPSDGNVDMDGESLHKGYYLDGEEEATYDTGSDLIPAAGNNVARGHSRGDYGGGGGYGHGGGGGGGGGGGLSDPFTILGGLAFLTYLAMLIQQQMAATPPAGGGRETVHITEDALSSALQTIPWILNKLKLKDNQLSSITNFQKKMATVAPIRKRKGNSLNSVPQVTPPQTNCRGLCRILKKLPQPRTINSTLLLLKQEMGHGSPNMVL